MRKWSSSETCLGATKEHQKSHFAPGRRCLHTKHRYNACLLFSLWEHPYLCVAPIICLTSCPDTPICLQFCPRSCLSCSLPWRHCENVGFPAAGMNCLSSNESPCPSLFRQRCHFSWRCFTCEELGGLLSPQRELLALTLLCHFCATSAPGKTRTERDLWASLVKVQTQMPGSISSAACFVSYCSSEGSVS